MRIGFDAKRAFHNHTGLGNYSRTMIQSLSQYYPEHHYLLFNPKPSSLFSVPSSGEEILPRQLYHRMFPSLWRSRWMLNDIALQCDLFHGLSHELPFGSENLRIPKLVTIHDLIFEHYPSQYSRSDVAIYRKKFQYACQVADQVIAISQATKQDVMSLYGIAEHKITTSYQAIDGRFFTEGNREMKTQIRKRYDLPEKYLLSVGSIIERKNLKRVCEALHVTKLPLLVIGRGGKYKEEVQHFLKQNHLEERVLFLEDRFSSEEIHRDLPLIYQSSFLFLYPSLMEGFGLPVIEAMASGVPVITSNVSSLREIGEEAAYCVDPLKTESISQAIQEMEGNEDLYKESVRKGYRYAQHFTPEKCADHMISIYQTISKK